MAASFLYVPADRPLLFEKAMSSGADAVIFDLEDAVALAEKKIARGFLSDYLMRVASHVSGPEIWVRINSTDSSSPEDIDQLLEDIRSCAYPVLVGVVLAKCENTGQLARLMKVLEEVSKERSLGKLPKISALVESPMGVMNLSSICESGICGHVQIGEADLGSSVGIDSSNNDAFLTVRSMLVMTSAAFGLRPPIGPVMTDFKDLEGFRNSSLYLKSLGFAGRSCIHPSQVGIVNEVFHPSEREIAEAERVIEQYRAQRAEGRGVYLGDDGKMIDIAVVKSAMRVLSIDEEDL